MKIISIQLRVDSDKRHTKTWSKITANAILIFGTRLPNPASAFCEQHGNKPVIVTADDGSQKGICIFPDGSTCDEWAYFRGECGPAN